MTLSYLYFVIQGMFTFILNSRSYQEILNTDNATMSVILPSSKLFKN